jgi:hypothetical protein
MQVVNSRWRRISKTSAMLTDCFMAPPAQAPTGGSPGCVSQPGLNWWLVLRGGTQSLSDDSSWSSCAVIFPRTVRGIVGEVSPFPEEGGTTTWIENHRAILAWCDRPRPLCSEPGRVPRPACCTCTQARAPSDRTTKRHICVCTTGYSTAKTRVTRKVMESLPADHPWMRRVHNARAAVCPHALRLNCRKLCTSCRSRAG